MTRLINRKKYGGILNRIVACIMTVFMMFNCTGNASTFVMLAEASETGDMYVTLHFNNSSWGWTSPAIQYWGGEPELSDAGETSFIEGWDDVQGTLLTAEEGNEGWYKITLKGSVLGFQFFDFATPTNNTDGKGYESIMASYINETPRDLYYNQDDNKWYLDSDYTEIMSLEKNGMLKFSGGDGSAENPYQIENAEQLNNIREDLTANYVLTADIDLSGIEYWKKIGSTDEHFTGTFDGKGYRISNMHIIDDTNRMSDTNVGLFSYIENAVIINVILDGVDIRVYTGNIGAIAGTAKNSIIQECSIEGYVYGIGDYGSYTGGVVGKNESGKIQGIKFTGGVDGENYVGAIAASNTGTITSCSSFSGDEYNWVSAYYPGGIVGKNEGNVINCRNNIDVHGNRWGGTRSGGVVAQNSGKVERCSNSGRVSSVDYPSGRGDVGGICGLNSGTIKNCFNTGAVVSDRACVYGISGRGKIECCYNIGDLDGGQDYSNGTYEYGISEGKVENCYYIDNILEAGEGVCLSADALHKQDSFVGFDFDNIWTFDGANDGYPQLQEYNYDDITTVRSTNAIVNKYYGAQTYGNTKDAKVQDAALEFEEALENYIESFNEEAKETLGGEDEIVDLEALAKDLRSADEETTDKYITWNKIYEEKIPSDALDSVYYALASFLANTVDEDVDLGDIDFSKKSIENATKIVNSVRNGMCGGKYTVKHGNYEIEFDTLNMWGSFAGDVKVTKVKGSNKGATYRGVITSTVNGTKRVLSLYFDEMSDIVKDACKYALFSIISEYKDVAGISECTTKYLNEFMSDKVEILQKKGFGNVLIVYENIHDGYNAIKPIIQASKGTKLTTALKKSENIYNTIKDMEFSEKGIKKKSVKNAVKQLEEAREKLEIALFNKIYDADKEYNEEESFVDKVCKFFGIMCPVDFEIYNAEGELIGYVDSTNMYEEYIYYTDGIYIEVKGDTKSVYVPENKEVHFKFIATDDGEMNYYIEEINAGEKIGRLNYYKIPLVEGEAYTQTIPEACSLSDNTDVLQLEGNTASIAANEYLSGQDEKSHVTVKCESTEGGIVLGGEDYPKGDCVELRAVTEDDTYKFSGWYIDDALVSTEKIYRFTAIEDVTVEAKFEHNLIRETEYEVSLGENYNASFVDVYVNDGTSKNIYIKLQENYVESDTDFIEMKCGSSSNLVGNRYSYHRFRGGIIVVKQRYVKGAVLHFVETLDITLLHNYWVPKESMNRVVMPLP